MTWVMLSLRRNELQHSISDHTYEKLQLSRQLRRLSSFSSAIANGTITPAEIAGLGTSLFGDGLDFMVMSNEEATRVAQEQTDLYSTAYEGITKEQYYNNPSIAAEAQLYFDENDQLNTGAMMANFYKEALKEYAEQVYMPMLKAKEEEIQDQQSNLEALLEAENQELQAVKQSISQAIQEDTIKLS